MHLSKDFQPKHPKHYCTFIKRPSEIETTQTTCQEEKGEDYEDVIVYFLAVKAATYFFYHEVETTNRFTDRICYYYKTTNTDMPAAGRIIQEHGTAKALQEKETMGKSNGE